MCFPVIIKDENLTIEIERLNVPKFNYEVSCPNQLRFITYGISYSHLHKKQFRKCVYVCLVIMHSGDLNVSPVG